MDDRDLDETLGNTSQNDIVLNDTWETESSEDEEEGRTMIKTEDEDEDDDSFEESTDEEEIFGNHDDDEDIDLLKTVDRLQSKIASRQPKERKKLIVETRQENEYNLPTGVISYHCKT